MSHLSTTKPGAFEIIYTCDKIVILFILVFWVKLITVSLPRKKNTFIIGKWLSRDELVIFYQETLSSPPLRPRRATSTFNANRSSRFKCTRVQCILYTILSSRERDLSPSNFPLASSLDHDVIVHGVRTRDTRTITAACQQIQFLSV